VATSRKLVADSRLPEYALDRAFLLAAEAYQIAPTRDAHEHLIRLVHENDRFEQFLQAHESPITAVAYIRPNRTLITGDEGGRVIVWQLGWHGERRSFQPVEGPRDAGGAAVAARRVAADNSSFVAAYADGRVRVVALGKDLAAREAAACSKWGRAQVTLNADGSRAVVRGEDGRAAIWTVAPSGCTQPVALPETIDSFAVSRSGNVIAAPLDTGVLRWWAADGSGGRVAPAPGFTGSVGGSFDVRVSGDERWVAITNASELAVWTAAPGAAWRAVLSAPLQGRRTSMALSPNGAKVAVGLTDGTIDLWRLDTSPPRARAAAWASLQLSRRAPRVQRARRHARVRRRRQHVAGPRRPIHFEGIRSTKNPSHHVQPSAFGARADILRTVSPIALGVRSTPSE
jgi:WD40 repeat protein